MRHLGSVVLTLLVAPLVLLLAGRGLTAFTDAAGGSRTDPLATAVALAALAAGGLLYAGLTVPPLSPLGPLVGGGLYLTFGAVILLGPADLLDRLPVGGVRLDQAQVTAAAAVAVLLALPLLLTVFSRRRWRGPEPAVAYPPGHHPPLHDTQDMPTIPLF